MFMLWLLIIQMRNRNIVLSGFILIILLVLQSSGFLTFQIYDIFLTPNLVFIFVFLLAIRLGQRLGFIFIILGGFFIDVSSSGYLGIYTLSFFISIGIFSFVFNDLIYKKIFIVYLFFFLSMIAYNIILMISFIFVSNLINSLYYFKNISLVEILINTAFFPVLYFLVKVLIQPQIEIV